jgi:uncharacterized membrane protein
MMDWYANDWGAAGFTGLIIMIAVWVSVIALVVWVIVRLTGPDRTLSPIIDSARAILDRRLASGDITTEEYVATRKVLESSGSGDSS